MDKLYLLFPLAAGIGYALAAMMLKRAADYGVGATRAAFVNNICFAVVLAPVFLFADNPSEHVEIIPWGMLIGALGATGFLLTVMALTRGDVSVATPILGMKTVFVPFVLATFFGQSLPWTIWAGALLSVLGIFIMQLKLKGDQSKVWISIILGLTSSLFFAFGDSIFQEYGGPQRFFVLISTFAITGAVVSLIYVPFFRGTFREIPKAGWYWLIGGCLLLVIQAFGLFIGIGMFQDAAGSNIVYSARGMWSVLLVYLVGGWFGNTELKGEVSRGRAIQRLIGSVLITLAVFFVFVGDEKEEEKELPRAGDSIEQISDGNPD